MGKWRLNPAEVVLGVSSSSSSTKHGQFSRKLHVTSCTVYAKHLPTGLTVEENIPLGHYSKKEMKKLRDELCAKLFPILEAKVGKHLRMPGR